MRIDPNTKEVTLTEREYRDLVNHKPDVDLELEIEEWWQNWASPPRNEYAVFNKEEFINIVRHFYELKLKARKED